MLSSPLRKLLVTAVALLLAVGLGSAAPSTAGPADPAGAPGPIHAGNTFGWYGHGGLVWREEFVSPLHLWHVDGPGAVRIQHGMLTLNTTRKGTVSATLDRKGRSYGRWETRMRSRVYGKGAKQYRVTAELVPVTKVGERCGEQNVGFTKYKPLSHRANFYIRTRPSHLYQSSTRRGFGQDQWHTFAVEVTHKHISWFVDSHVVATETKPVALSGAKFHVRFTMEAQKGKIMNKARMQMDWLRYWSLAAPNKKSTKAPAPKESKYTLACPPSASSSH